MIYHEDTTMLQGETRKSALESLISVAMCTFNGARFLAQQLESIQAQTRRPDELVVCDDGSTDNSIQILQHFSRSAFFPVHIHRNDKRLGFAQNFAKCISLCHGDLIVLTDQDDVWYSTRIADTHNVFAANPLLTYTFSDAPWIDANGQELGTTIFSNMRVKDSERKLLQQGTAMLPILRGGMIYGCTMALRARFVPVILPIPELWSHDEWISRVLSSLGPSARQRPVTRYRQHPAQLVGRVRWPLQRHLEQVKKDDRKEYEAELKQYEFGLAAAESRPQLHPRLVPALQKQVVFFQARHSVRSGGLSAIPPLFQLLLSGDYWSQGAGVLSVLKDTAMMISSSAKRLRSGS